MITHSTPEQRNALAIYTNRQIDNIGVVIFLYQHYELFPFFPSLMRFNLSGTMEWIDNVLDKCINLDDS